MSTSDNVQYENLLPVGKVMERAAQYTTTIKLRSLITQATGQ